MKFPQRDNAGAIIQKRETINGTTVTYDYTFDNMGRLTQVQKNNTITEAYTYDNNGNRASATVNGTSITASYTLDDNLVVYGDNSYLYDDDGYLKTKTTPSGTTTYSYGTRGELLSVTTPTKTITYKHNALNQRVAKLINGQVVEKYLWANLTTLLAVYDSSDNLLQRFEYADQRMPVAMTKGADKFYLHYDQVGSLRAVTDSSHNIVKEITYDTYGNILSDSNPSFKVPFGFAGGLYDPLTKLTHFGYREYDAFTGKWTAKDPIGFAGGDSNLYGYVLNDPVNLVDPWGLDALNDLSNFFAGFGDAITFGLTEEFRKTYGYDSAVNKCSKAYNYGDWTSLGLGGLRLGYAGAAKGISWAASSGRQAANARNMLKKIFRANPFSTYRVYPYEKLLEKYGTDEAIKKAAGRTNGALNRLGGAGAFGGAINDPCECQ